MTDPLHEKGKTLEDIFFAARDREKIAALRAKAAKDKAAVDVAAITGISDPAVLARIAELGISPDTLAAFSLVPLLSVAWSDASLDHREREAILVEADAIGVREGTAAHELLSAWLHRDPDPALVEAWKGYLAALVAHLSPTEKEKLRAGLHEQAMRVARASGGVFKIGAVSGAEAEAIAKLDALFA